MKVTARHRALVRRRTWRRCPGALTWRIATGSSPSWRAALSMIGSTARHGSGSAPGRVERRVAVVLVSTADATLAHRLGCVNERYRIAREVQSGSPMSVRFPARCTGQHAATRPSPGIPSEPALNHTGPRPRKYSSARLIRIITGRPVFFDMCAGIDISGYAPAFDPKPPPQNSATKTRSSGECRCSSQPGVDDRLTLCASRARSTCRSASRRTPCEAPSSDATCRP